MKKIICLIACICCLLVDGITVSATARITRADDVSLTVQTAQQGDAKINFVREFDSRNSYMEIQHVMRGNEDYTLLHLQDWDSRIIPIPNRTILFYDGKTLIKTVDLQPITSGIYTPNGRDQWYNADDLPEWIETLSKAKKGSVKMLCNGHGFCLPHGKYSDDDETEFFKKAAKMMTLTKDAPVTYGPMYSVFFPGKKWTEVRDAFVYHLNNQSDNHWYFVNNDADHTIGISLYDDTNLEAYIKFIELPTGTWMNWDMWHKSYSNENGEDCTFYEAEEWGYANRYLTDIWNDVHKTYDALVPHSDYGIHLVDNFEHMYPTSPLYSSLPHIASVDVKNYPELACISEGDKIIQVNGKDVSKTPTYAVDYLLNYSQGNPDIQLTLKNSKNSVYNVTLKGKLYKPNVENIDYNAVNMQKGYKYHDTYHLPLAAIPNCYAPYEIYDPKGPQDANLESPGPIYDLTHNDVSSNDAQYDKSEQGWQEHKRFHNIVNLLQLAAGFRNSRIQH